eukprot:Colp12_sorted_trinity150504_noHs@19948
MATLLRHTTKMCSRMAPIVANRSYMRIRPTQRLRLPASSVLKPTQQLFFRACMSSDGAPKLPIGAVHGLLHLQFTCKVCDTRVKKNITKHSYQKGVVLVKCEGCKNIHLIADNLNWFAHVKGKNIEQILAEKGESVRRIALEEDGAMEFVPDFVESLEDDPKKSEDMSTDAGVPKLPKPDASS